jgi:hypothetical protein
MIRQSLRCCHKLEAFGDLHSILGVELLGECGFIAADGTLQNQSSRDRRHHETTPVLYLIVDAIDDYLLLAFALFELLDFFDFPVAFEYNFRTRGLFM